MRGACSWRRWKKNSAGSGRTPPWYSPSRSWCSLSPSSSQGACRTSSGPSGFRSPAAVLVSLGFFLCSFTHSLTYLFICFGVIGGLGNGFGYSTPIPVMAKWFPDKRGLAVGLAVGGYGAGSALFGPLANLKLIPAYGVHTTFKILGGNFPGDDGDRCVLAEESSSRDISPRDGRRHRQPLRSAATTKEFTPSEVLTDAVVLFHVDCLCARHLGRPDGHQPTGSIRQERGHSQRGAGDDDTGGRQPLATPRDESVGLDVGCAGPVKCACD